MTVPFVWDVRRIDTLRQAVCVDKQSFRAAAEQVGDGCNHDQARNKAIELGFHQPVHRIQSGFWTAENSAALERLICVEGKTYLEASRELGCTKNMCVGRGQRMGLLPDADAPLSRAQIVRRAIIEESGWAGFWTPEKLAGLERLITEEWRSIGETAQELGCTRSMVINKALRMGYWPPAEFYRKQVANSQTVQRLEAMDIFPQAGHCTYPLGHPDKPGFHFCGDAIARRGLPYCPTHMVGDQGCYLPADAPKLGWRKPIEIAEAV